MAVRHLNLARHGEPDENGRLTERGRRQAELLGHRLSWVPLTSVHHGPLPRATETAHLVAGRTLSVQLPVVGVDAGGDFVPYVPTGDEIP